MPLTSSTRLGPYQIIEPIGAGGMGEVYRARDTRLNRDVAVKVLPSDVAHDAARRHRFEEEARAVAALNHPNILSVFDVGDDYMVTELVEGESLRDAHLTQRKTVEVVAQIADGLAAAHEAGITHRDLKPDNVLLTRDGRVKILDFGLARVNASGTAQDSRTITDPGTVMGTPGYMSPEQVRGSNVDHRSDIFSLGVVLYELLSGKRAFEGASSADMMSAILREDPAELPESVPLGLRQIVHRCLEKKPEERFQSARDLAFALRSLSGSTGVAKIIAAPPVSGRRWLWPAALAVPSVVAMAFAALWFTRSQGSDLSRYRYTPFATDAEPEINPAWSPDGKSIAYLKRLGLRYQLMVRALNAPVPVQLTKTADGVYMDVGNRPIWSPDGSRIYFVGARPGRLWSVSVAGGEPQEVFPNTPVSAAALSVDGKAFALWRIIRQEKKASASLWISSPAGAPPHPYRPAPFEVDAGYTGTSIRFSPDGAHIGLSIVTSGASGFWLLPWPEAHSAPRQLFSKNNLPDAPRFDWMPDSRHLVMGMEGGLWLGDSRTETLDRLTASATEGDDTPSVSPDGQRVAFGTGNTDYDIVSIPLDGSPPQPILATARDESAPTWSLSGRMAFITNRSGQDEIWLRDAQGDLERPIVTQNDFPDDKTLSIYNAALSPDGGRIAYNRQSAKVLDALWISPASGGRPASVPMKAGDVPNGLSWAPDGKALAFIGGSDAEQLAIVQIGSDLGPKFLAARCGAAPAWSPDGHWIACGAVGESSILLTSPDGTESRKLPSPVRTDAQQFVTVWSRDSSTIYVASSLSDPARLDAIDVRTGATRKIADLGSGISFRLAVNFMLSGSLAPDGKSFATTVAKTTSDIWILDGFAPTKRRWFGR